MATPCTHPSCPLEATTGSGACVLHEERDGKERGPLLQAFRDLAEAGVVRIQGLYLRGADLTGLHLQMKNLQESDFTGARMTDARFDQVGFDRTIMDDVDLENAILSRVDLRQVQSMRNIRWYGSILDGVRLPDLKRVGRRCVYDQGGSTDHEQAIAEARLARAQAESRLKQANAKKRSLEESRTRAAEDALRSEKAHASALKVALNRKTQDVESRRSDRLAKASEEAQERLAFLEGNLIKQRSMVRDAQQQAEVEQARVALIKDHLEGEQKELQRLKQAEYTYRTLKELYKSQGRQDEAGVLYEREMDMKRFGAPLIDKLWLTTLWLVCGYGERPLRLTAVFATTVLMFAAGFSVAELKGPEGPITGDFGRALYFSIVTFTSLGYGDITPVGFARLLAGTEALLGVFMISLFVFVFCRRMVR